MTWIIIMALLLHIRRVCAVSVLQYSKFAYEFAYARVWGVVCACVCVCKLCVWVTVRTCVFFRLVLNTKTQNSERISKKVRFFIAINTYRLYI